jgi:lipoprotein-anchoring transpeptidase ErfK/SrfK
LLNANSEHQQVMSMNRRSFIYMSAVAAMSSSAFAQDLSWFERAMSTVSPDSIEPSVLDETKPLQLPEQLKENPAVKEHPLYGGDAVIRDPNLIPPAESPIDYEITKVSANTVPQKFRRQEVEYFGLEPAGTIVISPSSRYLYYVLGDGLAIRYGVGVGRAGFAWSGSATIELKRRWPRWMPPEEMVFRDKKAMTWANGMPGGPTNPLGARALYLYANGVDTLFRIHGTNEPQSIGQAMSSGCIRMLNEDIAELFDRVTKGTPVVVLATTNQG